ncbi:N-glycosidase YbiA-like isoform X4 [Haliotis rubra]|uniref:N-glycosidase YbiA-like isoform X4 n=1 Tax=Haliotis rubra TaxID=36100 RepID=UPI001EE5C667|nr:N-glycosidase YbiA-like isoform X4 [Haliotis rubra]
MSSRKRKWDGKYVEVDPSKRRRSESYFQAGSPNRHNFHRGDRFPGRPSQKYELFFGWQSPFSQHHPVKFTVDGKEFNCAEQYYMYRKAALFKDKNIQEKIMNSWDPKEQKRLGKQIQNFDFDTWMQHSKEVVEKGNMAKFSQNPHLKEKLFATAPRLMVEASPYDATWGIALHKNDPRAWDERTWQGQNLLGQIITKVRDNLMRQDGVLVGEEGGSMEKTDYSSTGDSSDGFQCTSNTNVKS